MVRLIESQRLCVKNQVNSNYNKLYIFMHSRIEISKQLNLMIYVFFCS